MRPVQECGSILSNAEKLVVVFRQTDDGATETQMRYLEVLCGADSKGKDVSDAFVEARVCTFDKNTICPSFTCIISPSLRCALIGLSSTTMRIVTGAEEVGLAAVLEEVLDVPHLVVHCDEVLLVHPASKHFLC